MNCTKNFTKFGRFIIVIISWKILLLWFSLYWKKWGGGVVNSIRIMRMGQQNWISFSFANFIIFSIYLLFLFLHFSETFSFNFLFISNSFKIKTFITKIRNMELHAAMKINTVLWFWFNFRGSTTNINLSSEYGFILLNLMRILYYNILSRVLKPFI